MGFNKQQAGPYVSFKEAPKLPSSWQLGDKVQVVFPENGKLQGKIIKVSFTEYGEVRYDVEIPFIHDDEGRSPNGTHGYFRIHGVDQYFLSYTQEDLDKMQKDDLLEKDK